MIFGERGQMIHNTEEAMSYSKSFNQRKHGTDLAFFGLMESKVSVPNAQTQGMRAGKTDWKSSAGKRSCWDVCVRTVLSINTVKNIGKAHLEQQSMKERGTEKRKSPSSASSEEIRELMTKKNEPMAFLKSRRSRRTHGSRGLPKDLLPIQAIPRRRKNGVAIKGKISKRNGEISDFGRCGEGA